MAKAANKFADRDIPCLERILQFSESMSANELKLADFVLKNAPLLRDYSSQQLAATVKVSQSSVIKFSQKLGYSGFPDLKLALTAEIAKGRPQAAPDGAPPQKRKDETHGLYYQKIQYLQTARDQNTESAILGAVKAIEKCSRLVLIAAGDALPPARVFADEMLSVGVSVLLAADTPTQHAVTASMSARDAMLAVSPGRQLAPVAEMARAAKKAGAGVISITGLTLNHLQAHSDHKLYVRVEEEKVEFKSAMMRFALNDIFDTLFLQLVARDEKKRDMLVQINRRMAE